MRPEIVDQYRNAKLEENRQKAIAEKLKPKIKELIEETGGWDDLYFQPAEKIVWHEEVLYDWVAAKYPEFLPQLTKKVIDVEELGRLIKLEWIDDKTMPNNAYTTSTTFSIQTKPRKKKDENDSE